MTDPGTQTALRTARRSPDLSAAPVIIPVIVIGAGAYLAWFAVRYWRGTGQAVWPSYPVRQILQGKGLPANTQAAATSSQVSSWEAQQGGGSVAGPAQPSPGSGSERNTARLMFGRFGWPASQMNALIPLWNQESGWKTTARNPKSGALGIAQALGHGGPETAGKLGNEYGDQYGLSVEQARAANSGNALQQIRWGLGYIKAVYGTPDGAWLHETNYGWY